MRFLMVLIVAAAGLTPTSCADPVDDTPLRGSQGGLSVVRWGDGPEVVQRRILEMPDVSLIRDTLEIHAFAAWMTPDTVEAPESIPYYRIMEFRGGKFLGYPVERWIVTYDDATSFRQVQVCLASMQEAVEAQWKIRRQLRQLYRRPNDPDLEPNRFFADDWATPASSASTARTSVGIDIYGPEITVGFVDRAWDDQRWPSRYDRQRRRMHVDEWRRYLAKLAKERGWKMDDLPPQ